MFPHYSCEPPLEVGVEMLLVVVNVFVTEFNASDNVCGLFVKGLVRYWTSVGLLVRAVARSRQTW